MSYTITGQWIPDPDSLPGYILPPDPPRSFVPSSPAPSMSRLSPHQVAQYHPDARPVQSFACPHCMYCGPVAGYNWDIITSGYDAFKRFMAIPLFIFGIFTAPVLIGFFIMAIALKDWRSGKTTFIAHCPNCHQETQAYLQ